MIFHLAAAEDWNTALAAGTYPPATSALAQHGAVPAAYAEQVAPLAHARYGDAGPLVLLVIDTDRLDAPVVEEAGEAPGAARPYPHIHGPVRVDAVIAARPYAPAAGGAFPVVEPPRRRQRLAAYAVVTDGSRLLLTRNSATTPAPGTWALPGGGVDHGEHPLDALRREVLEETGLQVRVGALLEVDSHRFVGFSPAGVLEDLHAVRLLYAADVEPGGVPRVVDVGGSTDASAWVARAALATYPLTATARLGARLAGFEITPPG